MKRRMIPFGYQMRKGEICIQPDEAARVEWIFTAYLNDQSYQEIANTLTKENVHFIDTRDDWDKHRVKRLLQDKRYVGCGEYAQIVDVKTFKDVSKRIQSKSLKKRTIPPEVSRLKEKLYCANCQRQLRRYTTHGRYAWTCPEKTCRVSITKRKLDEYLLMLQREMIAYDPLSDGAALNAIDDALQAEITTLDLEIKRCIDDQGCTDEAMTNLIYRRAEKCYLFATCDYQDYKEQYNALISGLKEDEALDGALIFNLVKTIHIHADKHIDAMLYIGKCLTI